MLMNNLLKKEYKQTNNCFYIELTPWVESYIFQAKEKPVGEFDNRGRR